MIDYRTQSEMSDPGAYAYLFDALPDDLTSLCKAVQGIYQHYMTPKAAALPPERRREVDTRRLDLILKRIIELDPRPLYEGRPTEQRFVGCCRDASLLLCAMLRHKGTPARCRSGFARYIRSDQPGFKPDHVIVEYHDGTRWKLVDAEQSEKLIAENAITFDVQDIPRDQFIVGGLAWQMCRKGEDAYENYGSEPSDTFWRGEWAIRSRMVGDFAMLNKVEYLLWDGWGLNEWMESVGTEDMALLDRAAALTASAHDDSLLDDIQALYQNPRFHAPRTFSSWSPVDNAESKVTL